MRYVLVFYSTERKLRRSLERSGVQPNLKVPDSRYEFVSWQEGWIKSFDDDCSCSLLVCPRFMLQSFAHILSMVTKLKVTTPGNVFTRYAWSSLCFQWDPIWVFSDIVSIDDVLLMVRTHPISLYQRDGGWLRSDSIISLVNVIEWPALVRDNNPKSPISVMVAGFGQIPAIFLISSYFLLIYAWI